MTEPEWVDVNPSDPGITIVELFAFLAVAFGIGAVAWALARWFAVSRDTPEP